MDIESYFEHIAPDDIRIRGTRIGIESVLYEYIYRQESPEAIVNTFPSLKLEEVYVTILYYLHNRASVEAYMTDWLVYSRQARAEQDRNPPPIVLRLRVLKKQRQQAPSTQ